MEKEGRIGRVGGPQGEFCNTKAKRNINTHPPNIISPIFLNKCSNLSWYLINKLVKY